MGGSPANSDVGQQQGEQRQWIGEAAEQAAGDGGRRRQLHNYFRNKISAAGCMQRDGTDLRHCCFLAQTVQAFSVDGGQVFSSAIKWRDGNYEAMQHFLASEPAGFRSMCMLTN